MRRPSSRERDAALETCYESRVERPLHVVFAFHRSPANLARLLGEWPGFGLLAHEQEVAEGSETWIQQRVAGMLPVAMGFLHTTYDPPRRFEETMIHGPFEVFVHSHEFVDAGVATIVRDRVRLTLPWWYGGRWMSRKVPALWLDEFFAFRHRRLAELVEAGALD